MKKLAVFLVLIGLCLGPVDSHAQSSTWGQNLKEGKALFKAKRYAEALPYYEKAVDLAERKFGPENLVTALLLGNLAKLHMARGKYAEAELLHMRVLAIREKVFGPNNLSVAESLNNLAILYQAQGKYAKAEPLYKRALAIREKVLGPEHRIVATSLDNLAQLYRDQAKYAESEPLYERALAIREKALGPEHPDVAQSLGQLAWFLAGQGSYADAEPLYRRALAILEGALGADHRSVAGALDDLAAAHYNQGKFTEGKLLHTRALAIREKILGRYHPEIVQRRGKLTFLYPDLSLASGKAGELRHVAAQESNIMFLAEQFAGSPIYAEAREGSKAIDEIAVYDARGFHAEIFLSQGKGGFALKLWKRQTPKESLSTWRVFRDWKLTWGETGSSDSAIFEVDWQKFDARGQNCFVFYRAFAPKATRRQRFGLRAFVPRSAAPSPTKFMRGFFCNRPGEGLADEAIHRLFRRLGVRGFAEPDLAP